MRKIFSMGLASAVAIWAMPTAGQEGAEVTKYCQSLGSMAGSLMEARQRGTPMSKLMVAAEDMSMEAHTLDLIRSLIEAAYDENRWQTEENQQRAIEDFRIEAERACFKSFK